MKLQKQKLSLNSHSIELFFLHKYQLKWRKNKLLKEENKVQKRYDSGACQTMNGMTSQGTI